MNRILITVTVAAAISLAAVGAAAVVGDMDGSGAVDKTDLGLFFAAWRAHAASQAWDHAADLDHNDTLDRRDADLMVGAYIAATYVDPQALLIAAEDDLAANDLADAAGKLAVVIAARPTWARPHGVLAAVLQLQGQATEATTEYSTFARTWRTNAGVSTSPVSDREGRFYFLLNGARISNGLPPLKPDPRVALGAMWHSDYQRSNLTVTHYEYDRPGYVEYTDRMNLALGFDPYCNTAENVAGMWGNSASGSASAVDTLHTLLMNSPGHYANIMRPLVSDLGLALSIGSTATFVTQDFAQLQQGGVGPGIGPAEAKAVESRLSGPLELVLPRGAGG